VNGILDRFGGVKTMGHRPVKKDAPGMRGQRGRSEESGQLRQKRGDTLASTLEQEYGVDLGVRGDTRLDTLRKRTGETSVEKVIDKLAGEK
jgi:hypothetical protein